MERRSPARLVAATLTLLAIAASPAAAASLPLATGASAPAGALTSSGDAVAAWNEAGALRASVTPHGGTPSTTSLDDAALAPAVAADDAGGAFAAWRRAGAVRVAYRPAGGGFGAPQDLGAGDGDPALAARADGEALAAWVRGTEVVAAVKRAGAAWSAPEHVAGPFADAPTVHAGLDGAGDALVVWNDPNGVRAATRAPAAAAWTTETLGQSGGAVRGVQLAAGEGGAVVAWAVRDGNQTTSTVRAALRPNGGPFAAPTDLPSTVLFDDVPAVGIDDSGDAAVVWPEGYVRADGWAGLVGPIAGATGRVGQGFGAVRIVSGAHPAKAPAVAVGPGGEALVSWQDWSGGAEFARMPAAGDADAPAPVACDAKGNTALPLGVDANGTATLLDLDAGTAGLVQDGAGAGAGDACGARLRVLGPAFGGRPATATAGQSVALDGLDFIPRFYNPPVLRSEWDFDGDGRYDTSVDGYQARTTFPRPGRYPVTMRLTWTWPSGAVGSEVHRTVIDVVSATAAPNGRRRAGRRGAARHTPATIGLAALLRRGVPVRIGPVATSRGHAARSAPHATVIELVARGRVVARRAVPKRATRVTVRPRSRRALRARSVQVRARSGRRVLWRETVAIARG